MRNYLVIFFSFLLFGCSSVQHTDAAVERTTFYSAIVKDSFLISVKKPLTYSKNKKYKTFLIADGAIKLGKNFLSFFDNYPDSCKTDMIVVTISHLGDWHMKRRRDFIPSDISANSSEVFGNANSYHNFLKTELLPYIKQTIPNTGEMVFVGHSFTGLFSLYLALKDPLLFQTYYAISPSCWANYNEISKIEEAYRLETDSLPTTIKMYAGSREVLNKVLSSSSGFYKTVTQRNYKALKISYEILQGEDHISILQPAINKVIISEIQND
jgi:predicted alpha/beta superfamily hydrolase